LFIDCIDEDRDKQASKDNQSNEDLKDSMYQNIIFGQMLSIVYNMIEFKISNESILNFINNNSKKHSLSEEFQQAVLQTIQNMQEDHEKLKCDDERNLVNESLKDEIHLQSSLEVNFY